MSLVFKIAWGVVFGYLMLFVILFFLALIGFALFGNSIRDSISRKLDL
jgi:hypothetical protein